jgi:hypothetical protein
MMYLNAGQAGELDMEPAHQGARRGTNRTAARTANERVRAARYQAPLSVSRLGRCALQGPADRWTPIYGEINQSGVRKILQWCLPTPPAPPPSSRRPTDGLHRWRVRLHLLGCVAG